MQIKKIVALLLAFVVLFALLFNSIPAGAKQPPPESGGSYSVPISTGTPKDSSIVFYEHFIVTEGIQQEDEGECDCGTPTPTPTQWMETPYSYFPTSTVDPNGIERMHALDD